MIKVSHLSCALNINQKTSKHCSKRCRDIAGFSCYWKYPPCTRYVISVSQLTWCLTVNNAQVPHERCNWCWACTPRLLNTGSNKRTVRWLTVAAFGGSALTWITDTTKLITSTPACRWKCPCVLHINVQPHTFVLSFLCSHHHGLCRC